MNRKSKYFGDTRYENVFKQMKLLGIQDVSTKRQDKNGTIVWKLPIKNVWPKDKSGKSYKCIEVASFKTGYVRNQNSGYSNYQLNKRCQNEPEYFKDYKTTWHDDGTYTQKFTGKYRKFETRGCKLIPIEIDRLEYLISYCLKNYFIKRANEVADGEYIHKSLHKWELKKANETYSENTGAMARINDMEEKLDAMTEARDYYLNKAHSLENKLEEEVKRYDNAVQPLESELAEARVRQDVSVIVNGHRYKVI